MDAVMLGELQLIVSFFPVPWMATAGCVPR